MAVVVEDDEALHAHALLQKGVEQQWQAIRPIRQIGAVVLRDYSADRHPCAGIEQRQHCIEYLAADVLEIDVNTVRAVLGQLLWEVAGPVIDTGIEAKRFDRMPAFFSAASDTDHAAAFQLADLPDRCPNGPGGCCDHQGFPSLGLADVEQAHVSGEARHAQYTKGVGRMRHIRGELDQPLSIGQRIVLPAIATEYPVTFLVVGMK